MQRDVIPDTEELKEWKKWLGRPPYGTGTKTAMARLIAAYEARGDRLAEAEALLGRARLYIGHLHTGLRHDIRTFLAHD